MIKVKKNLLTREGNKKKIESNLWWIIIQLTEEEEKKNKQIILLWSKSETNWSFEHIQEEITIQIYWYNNNVSSLEYICSRWNHIWRNEK